jgi:hypothetical protein
MTMFGRTGAVHANTCKNEYFQEQILPRTNTKKPAKNKYFKEKEQGAGPAREMCRPLISPKN